MFQSNRHEKGVDEARRTRHVHHTVATKLIHGREAAADRVRIDPQAKASVEPSNLAKAWIEHRRKSRDETAPATWHQTHPKGTRRLERLSLRYGILACRLGSVPSPKDLAQPHLGSLVAAVRRPRLWRELEAPMPLARTRVTRASMVPVGGVALAIVRVASRLSAAIRGDTRPKDELPTTIAKDSERNRRVLAKLHRLKQPYEVVSGLGNGHVETIFAAFFRSQPDVKYHRDLILCTTDGGCVALDWPVEASHENEKWAWDDLPDDAPVVVLFPGLTGGSGDSYVKHMVLSCRKYGMRAVVFNSRSTADSPVTTPQFYSASFTGDAKDVMLHVHSKYPNALLFAAGWSLGANILVRYLGEVGEDTPLRAAISLCNPFDLTLSDRNFQKGFNRIYDYKLGRTLSRMFRKHMHLFDGMEGQGFKPHIAMNSYTIRDFDEAVTRVSFGFDSVDEYYEWSGSCHMIPKVRIPLLCVQAADDPIAPAHAIPYDELRCNDNCILVVTPNGGHLGWISGETAPFGAPWTDSLCTDFLNTMKEELVRL